MKRRILLIAMRRRGSQLMRRWQRLIDHLADGHVDAAERFYPHLVTIRKRALRLARRLHALNHVPKTPLGV